MSVEAQLDLLEIRRSLEELAVRQAARRSEPGQREAMGELARALAAFAGDDRRALAPLLGRSHGLIAAAARTPYLPVAMAPLQGLLRPGSRTRKASRPTSEKAQTRTSRS